jgi:hypothetical protein
MNPVTSPHPWITALQDGLDQLERALLQGDADAVQRCSAQVQAVLQQAPKTAQLSAPGQDIREDLLRAAQRFGQLRHAVQRMAAQSQRAVNSLLPQQAPATYGQRSLSSTGGAGQAYLRA